jgi:hypothetical protein
MRNLMHPTDPVEGAVLSMVPGVGELNDLAVIHDPNAAAWQKAVSVSTLAFNALAAGVLPNVGSLLRADTHAAGDAAKIASAAANGARQTSRVLPRLDPDSLGWWQKQLRNGRITEEQLRQLAHPDSVEEILRRLKKQAGLAHDAEKVIDDITKSERAVKNALERVRQHPGNRAALEDLLEAQRHLSELKKAFDVLRRREHGI